MSGHSILQIIKGVQKVPGDTLSSEQGLDTVDLLDPLGFSTDTYEMKIPALKSSAVYADSPLTDGRTLISGVLGNVTETIRMTLTAGTIVQMSAMLSKLLRFKKDCNDFWDTFGQIEPVYIKHQVSGEPGPRYALLYDIDVAIDPVINPGDPTRDLTIVIERETYWRGLAPGDNPKRWTIENFFTGQTWNSANADLIEGSNHLFDETLQNRQEYNVGQTALLSKNYVDIPAAAIPGDVPALLELYVETMTAPSASNRLYVGLSSKPDVLVTGSPKKPNYILNAGDSGLGTDSTFAADTGAPIRSSNGTNTRSTTSFGTVTAEAVRVRWSPSDPGYFDMATLRGRYIALLRCRLSAASTVSLRLVVSDDIGTIRGLPYTLTDVGSSGTGNTTQWHTAYLGVVSFPFNEQRTVMGHDGLGVNVETSGVSTLLEIHAARIGVATNLYIADLILIPIDEHAALIQAEASVSIGNGYIIDNTGYYLHGITGSYASIQDSATADAKNANLFLAPKVRNRLIFFTDLASTNGSVINNTFRARGNIVPRWAGLRDV